MGSSHDDDKKVETAMMLVRQVSELHHIKGQLEDKVGFRTLGERMIEYRREQREERREELDRREAALLTKMEQVAMKAARSALKEHWDQEDRTQRRARLMAIVGGGAGLGSAILVAAQSYFGGG